MTLFIVACCFLVATLSVGFSVSLARVRREERTARIAAIQAKHRELIESAMRFGQSPEPLRPLWSEQERELFGYNDTERWLEETGNILKKLEWDSLTEDVPDGNLILADEFEQQQGVSAAALGNAWAQLGYLPNDTVEIRVGGNVTPIRTIWGDDIPPPTRQEITA